MHIAQGLQACGSADYLAYPSCLQFVAGVTLRVVQVPVTDHTILESGLHARQKDALWYDHNRLDNIRMQFFAENTEDLFLDRHGLCRHS